MRPIKRFAEDNPSLTATLSTAETLRRADCLSKHEMSDCAEANNPLSTFRFGRVAGEHYCSQAPREPEVKFSLSSGSSMEQRIS